MAKCPKCGVKLHIWNIKAECPKCGVNIANYDWENRLEQDAKEAEIAFAKMRETLNKFKYSLAVPVYNNNLEQFTRRSSFRYRNDLYLHDWCDFNKKNLAQIFLRINSFRRIINN